MDKFYSVCVGESFEDFKSWASGVDTEIEWFVAYDPEGKFNVNNVIDRCLELGLLYQEDVDKVIWATELKNLDKVEEAISDEVFFSLA